MFECRVKTTVMHLCPDHGVMYYLVSVFFCVSTANGVEHILPQAHFRLSRKPRS